MTRAHFAIMLAVASAALPLGSLKAAEMAIIAYAPVDRLRPDFIRKDVTPDTPATECPTPPEDMECTTGN